MLCDITIYYTHNESAKLKPAELKPAELKVKSLSTQ
jgi:hypothetical protein